MLHRVTVSQIIGDLSQLNASAKVRSIDLPELEGRMQEWRGHLQLAFDFESIMRSTNTYEVLIAQPLEDSECLIAVNPDIIIFHQHALDCFANRPLRFTIISDQAAIRAWVRGLQKLGVDCHSIYSADIDHHPNGRSDSWKYDLTRALALPPGWA